MGGLLLSTTFTILGCVAGQQTSAQRHPHGFSWLLLPWSAIHFGAAAAATFAGAAGAAVAVVAVLALDDAASEVSVCRRAYRRGDVDWMGLCLHDIRCVILWSPASGDLHAATTGHVCAGWLLERLSA